MLSGSIVLLGPQRPSPNITEVLERLPAVAGDASRPFVTITAGWRHDESDCGALHRALWGRAVHLPLYTWFDEVMRADPAFASAYKGVTAQLKEIKRLHRVRQQPALDAVQRLLGMAEKSRDLARPQLLWALEDVRRIDDQLIRQSHALRERHPVVAESWSHPLVAARRAEAMTQIADARAVCIAGGHVAVLRNRLQFFGLAEALSRARTVVAWSAGAMVLTERIVLFYDDPPEGASHAEVLDDGFGLVRDCVLLPHARRRLKLDDNSRTSLLATRFAPQVCLGLENGAWVDRLDGRWVNRGAPGSALVLGLNGAVVPLEQAA